ncbi:MAG: DUF3592 domain-containing protein [Novipirellula sp. JB048]
MAADMTAALEQDLSEIFAESISVAVHQTTQAGDANLSLITMDFTRRHHSSDTPTTVTRIHQSAVVLQESALELPAFSLDPKRQGIIGKLLSSLTPLRLGSLAGLDFPDTPEFTEAYDLIAWVEPSVRVLFTRPLREHLSEQRGWSVKGQGQYLILYRRNQVIDKASSPTFLQDALAIAERFQEGEEQLDQRPDLRRETRAEDMEAMADRMGGVVGTLLKNQLRKIAVTHDELESFFAEARPRTIPSGMKAQVLGNTLPVVLFGSLFLLVGLGLGGALLVIQEGDRIIVAVIALGFSLLGATMGYFAQRFRLRKRRVCRHGEIVQAKVTEVQRTSTSVNNQTRYHVSFEFRHRGQRRTATANVYGPGVKRAEAFLDAQTSLRVLVDPKDASHVLCPELLVLWQ